MLKESNIKEVMEMKTLKEFLEASKSEESQWKKICNEFENRFDVPYRIDVEAEENALLGEKALQFIITYYDGIKMS